MPTIMAPNHKNFGLAINPHMIASAKPRMPIKNVIAYPMPAPNCPVLTQVSEDEKAGKVPRAAKSNPSQALTATPYFIMTSLEANTSIYPASNRMTYLLLFVRKMTC